MGDRPWHVGICGTFDVANYGDVLFDVDSSKVPAGWTVGVEVDVLCATISS